MPRAPHLILAGGFLLACHSNPAPHSAPWPGGDTPAGLPLTPVRILTTAGGVEVRQGGFGSALALVPGQSVAFYLLTDRGPNVDMVEPDRKGFPVPDYSPSIGEFRLEGGRLVRQREVVLRWRDGTPISGRPNPPGPGNTGETAATMDGRDLPLDPHGLDTEGLAPLDDGGFWVSDEYGPWLLRFGADGRLVERLGPFPSADRRLPSVLAMRRPGRGMEGLTRVPGTPTLVGLMQSPLDNPRAAGRKSRALRLVAIEPASGATRQHVYLLEDAGHRITEIAAVTASRFLVIEIDGEMPGRAGTPGFQRVFQVDLDGATDVSDPMDTPAGRHFGGRTLEQLDSDSLVPAGVVSVRKTLVLDLQSPAIRYPHEKPEGLAVLDDRTIAIANDDDFGIDADGQGGMVAKRLADGRVSFNEVRIFRLPQPLR